MRLLRVYIDGYRNLKNVTVDFDKESLTTVVIGENGSGKSNLIEAIVEIFRAWDFDEAHKIGFEYEVVYRVREFSVRLRGNPDKSNPGSFIPNASWSDPCFPQNRGHGISSRKIYDKKLLPDLIFGYYSGSGRRLEKLFDGHQSRYYGMINKPRPAEEYESARVARRLFYCRPNHGAYALLSFMAKPGDKDAVAKLLGARLGVSGFHSAFAHFKQPEWFNSNAWHKRERERDSGNREWWHRDFGNSKSERSPPIEERRAHDIWGARGPAGTCARYLLANSFHPIVLSGKVVEDYRKKARSEAQLACFLRDEEALKNFAANYESDKDIFAALEAADISDLVREMIVWVTRKGDDSGDISFSDLSDGERQLLMVLGLIRVSRGKEALFLLDEPDTHLNPAWQLTYLELIKEWTEVAADEDKCQIIMTTHNPLTIAALEAKEVRVMSRDDDGNVSVAPPRIDPRGLGFAGVLTDIFGLSSSLDKPTQEKIDRRNELAREEELTPALAKEFADIKGELRHLGFLYEERDKLYSEFLKQLKNVELADVEPLSPDEMREREAETRRIVEELLGNK